MILNLGYPSTLSQAYQAGGDIEIAIEGKEDIESEEEYSTDSVREEKGYNVKNEKEYNTDSDDLEEQDESTVVDESHFSFEGFHGEYGPYFQNFTSAMLFT